MFSFGYSFFLSGPIIGYTSLSYFYICLRKAMSRICGITIPAKNTHRKNTDRMLTIQIKLILYLTLIGRLCRSVLY